MHSLRSFRQNFAAVTARVVLSTLQRLEHWVAVTRPGAESGMTTAELLGNAALGIAALVAIWGVLQSLGLDVMSWIRGQLRV